MSIAVDLDGTLARYTEFRGATTIGEPIPAMRDRVLDWISRGKTVVIFTARMSDERSSEERAKVKTAIEAWCKENLGKVLPVTANKRMDFEAIYDDKARQVQKNTGRLIGG